MLVEFTVENYGPFREVATLDLRKTSGNELPDNTVKCDAVKGDLLRGAIIYGKNASGKSYLLKAVAILSRLVSAVPAPNMPIPFYNPFRLSKDTVSAPTCMALTFEYEGIGYKYSIAFDSKAILEESLQHNPNGRMACVFKRIGQKTTVSKAMQKEFSPFVNMAAPNAPFLTVAAQFNNELCRKVHYFITKNLIVIGDDTSGLMDNVIAAVANSSHYKDHIVNAMNIADFGISDIVGEVGKVDLESAQPGVKDLMMTFGLKEIPEAKLSMIHRYKKADVDGALLEFPSVLESTGTLEMFSIMGPVVDALEHGKVLLIDEFGSHLHTELSRWIINQFKTPNNPNDAQLVVNSHDLLLMDTDVLFRRDQIWFADKDIDTGMASVYSLSDFTGVRRDMDVMKSYLAGRFGALPFIDNGDLL